MKRLIVKSLTLAVLSTVAVLGPISHADAKGDGGRWSEYETRRDAYLPVSVKYWEGSAVKISPHVRCFTAQATKRTRVLGTVIPRGHLVGYCTDGYVDTFASSGGAVLRLAR
jgi:hypothetical protein